MKAITLHRPWGYFIVHCGKDIENRTWKPSLKVGEVFAIHHGYKWDDSAIEFAKRLGISDSIIDLPRTYHSTIPTGIIALAKYGGHCTQSVSRWFTGPIGWMVDAVMPIETIPCSGMQGLWTPHEGIQKKLEEARESGTWKINELGH